MNKRSPLSVAWALSRHWHQAALQRSCWMAALGLSVLALAGAMFWQWHQHAALLKARSEWQVFVAQGKGVQESQASSSPTVVDFTQRLPADAGTVQWVGDFQRAAAKLGVALVSLTDTPRPAQADQLGRHEIQLSLRGSYPPIKLLLKETLDRHPHTTVGRLNMRSLASPNEVEATVSLMVWSRPSPAGG